MARRKVNLVMLKTLHEQGLSDRELAKLFDVGRTSIRYNRKKLGLTLNGDAHYVFGSKKEEFLALTKQGLTDKRIASILHVCRASVFNWRKKLGITGAGLGSQKWRQKVARRKGHIIRLYHSGKSYVEIANELGFKQRYVQETIGFHLMNRCRKDSQCPFKSLLPEAEVGG